MVLIRIRILGAPRPARRIPCVERFDELSRGRATLLAERVASVQRRRHV